MDNLLEILEKSRAELDKKFKVVDSEKWKKEKLILLGILKHAMKIIYEAEESMDGLYEIAEKEALKFYFHSDMRVEASKTWRKNKFDFEERLKSIDINENLEMRAEGNLMESLQNKL